MLRIYAKYIRETGSVRAKEVMTLT